MAAAVEAASARGGGGTIGTESGHNRGGSSFMEDVGDGALEIFSNFWSTTDHRDATPSRGRSRSSKRKSRSKSRRSKSKSRRSQRSKSRSSTGRGRSVSHRSTRSTHSTRSTKRAISKSISRVSQRRQGGEISCGSRARPSDRSSSKHRQDKSAKSTSTTTNSRSATISGATGPRKGHKKQSSRASIISRSSKAGTARKSGTSTRPPTPSRMSSGLPGPDNGGPTHLDRSAVVALDQRKAQRDKQSGGKVSAKSVKSLRSSSVNSRGRSKRTSNVSGSQGHKHHRGRSRNPKSTHTSHRRHASRSSVGTAKSTKSARSRTPRRSSRVKATDDDGSACSYGIRQCHSGGSISIVIETKGIKKTRSAKMTSETPRRRTKHGGTGTASNRIKGHRKTSSRASTRSAKSTGSKRSTRSLLEKLLAQAAITDDRDDTYDSDSSDSDSSADDCTTDDCRTDDDGDNDCNDDKLWENEDFLSKSIRSIGVPLKSDFNDVRSKQISNMKKSIAKSKSKKAAKADASRSGSDIDEDEFYQGGSGDILHEKYRIVSELGKGTFGRVMKAYEIKEGSIKEKVGLGKLRGVIRPKKSGVVAIKITRNVDKYKKDAEIEAAMLRNVNESGARGTKFFPLLVDEFVSPIGHHCVVLEKLGMSLYHVLKANKHEPFSTEFVVQIGIQLFDGLDFLHNVGIIHTDLKPENILLVSNNCDPKDVRIKIIDLGSAEYERHANRYSIVNTRQYRAPEILLRIGWLYPSDVWAAGCALSELQLGRLLFAAKNDPEHLALIERVSGNFPRWMLLTASTQQKNEAAKCFDAIKGRHMMEKVLENEQVDYVTSKKPLEEQLIDVSDCELDENHVTLADVLGEVLSIDPMFRPTSRLAKELFQSIGEERQ